MVLCHCWRLSRNSRVRNVDKHYILPHASVSSFCRVKHHVTLSHCMAETSCEFIEKTSQIEQPESEATDQMQRTSSPEIDRTYSPTPNPVPEEHCKNKECLLVDTPRVGVFQLDPKSLDESLIGRGEKGQTFKFGKGKVTKGNVKAARNLMSREFPQVTQILKAQT